MAVTPSTDVYVTGKDAVVTIGNTSYAKAKVFELPRNTSGVVNITHLGGFQKVADGVTDFGRIRVVIPEAGQASVNNTTTSFIIATLNAKTYTNSTVYVVSDGGAVAQRGQSADREIIGECLAEGSWA